MCDRKRDKNDVIGFDKYWSCFGYVVNSVVKNKLIGHLSVLNLTCSI